jgi:hypothetical protein
MSPTRYFFFIVPFLVAMVSRGELNSRVTRNAGPTLASLGIVDAHAHVFTAAPAVFAMLDRLNLRFVNITVVDPYDKGFESVEPQQEEARAVARAAKGRAPWVATFDAAGCVRAA